LPASDTVTVAAGKTVDLDTTPALRQEIRAALGGRPATLVVDFRATEYMGAIGPAVVIGACRQAGSQGGRVIVVCDSEDILRGFRVTGLTKVLDIRPAPPDPFAAAGA
jgi:anti-sigma B factor antagonist